MPVVIERTLTRLSRPEHHGALLVSNRIGCLAATRNGLPDERKASAIAFLERALAWFARQGIHVERIMTSLEVRSTSGKAALVARRRQACPSDTTSGAGS